MTPEAIILDAMAELEEQGYKVTFADGWETRTAGGSFAPAGLVWHHTATSRRAQGDYPSLGIVRDGVDQGGGYFLPGPLSQFGLGRSGRIYVIAAGKANHAGPGGWGGLSGNYSVWGIEAEHSGTTDEPWPSEQVYAYIALSAALARHTGFDADMVCRHAEWSSAGKIDTAGDLDDGDWIRAKVAARLAGTEPEPIPEPSPEDDMAVLFIFDGPDGGIFYSDGATWKRGVPNGDALEPWRQGKAHHLGKISREYFDALPDWRPPGGLGLVAGDEALTGPLEGFVPEPLSCAGDES